VFVAVIAIIPPTLTAAAGWWQLVRERRERGDLAENYQGYVEDRARRDEALLMALERCYGVRSVEAAQARATDAGVVLDDLARSEGYRYR
jgi:hypothetical protein